jgi:DNA-binding MarR family transcriptional regulator
VTAKAAGRAAKPPTFRNLMTFRLHKVARISERISEQYYRKHMNLSLPECRMIGITAGYGTVSFKRVASDANLEKSYASRVVSALVDRGIIEKLVNPSDSRSVLIQLTEYGHGVHEQTYALALKLNARLQTPFRRKQVDEFVAFLGTLEQQLNRGDALVDGAGDWPSSAGSPSPSAESEGAADFAPAALDRDFARHLHDILGKYLAAKE